MGDPKLLGALIGWRRFGRSGGTILRIQAALSRQGLESGEFEQFDLLLTENQMRTLGQDLIRAADGKELGARRRWWQRG